MVDISESMGLRAARAERLTVPTIAQHGRSGLETRPVDFTDRQIAVLFIVLAAITLIPIVLYPWPPLTDYMNHLSRMHILATIDSDPDLSRFYEVSWQIIPNLMMDLIVPPLQRFMSVYLAGQVYTIASFVLIISGTLALNRQLFGRWSVLPLIAFPLLYNNVFLVGTLNYIFGMGLALWALTAWIGLRERHLLMRLAVSALFVLGLFFCHLFSVGLYGLGLLAFEITRLIASYKSQRLRASFVWELNGKVDGLVYVVEVYSHFAALLLIGIAAFAAGWGMRHRAFQLHPFGWALLILGSITYMAMPRVIFETYMADQRLPISLAFTVIACAHLNLRHDYVRRGFATVLVLLLAIRVFEVQTLWSEASITTSAFRDSVRQIERGAKVLVAYADPDAGDDPKELGLVHAACLAIIERSALVTTAFTVKGKQILEVREPYRARVDREDGTPPSVAQLMQVVEEPQEEGTPQEGARSYWSKWTSDYDYVYVLFTDPGYESPDPSRLTAIYTGNRFALFRINPAGETDPQPGPKVADTRGDLRPAR